MTEQLQEGFAFGPYEGKVKLLRRWFGARDTKTTWEELRTHVIIRNVFQHNKGKLRARDIQRLGLESITLTDDTGKTLPFRSGDQLRLSKRDVQRLSELMGECSKAFVKEPNVDPVEGKTASTRAEASEQAGLEVPK